MLSCVQAEASDQEMAEAGPLPTEPQEAGGDEATFRASDIEMGPGGLDEMDESFLEALPPDLREEMRVARAQLAGRSGGVAGGEVAAARPAQEDAQAVATQAAPQPEAAGASETPARVPAGTPPPPPLVLP
jgi:hypothetical protein